MGNNNSKLDLKAVVAMGVGGMVATGHLVKSSEERKLSTTFLPLKLPLSGLLQFRTKAIFVIYS